MKTLSNGGRLIEHESELPDLRNARDLFGDFETTSCDDDRDSLNPWHSCWALGIAVTADEHQGAWYVPLRHHVYGNERNIDVDVAREWWADVVSTAKCWTNHNIKYDAHVSANDMGVMPDWPEQQMFCTNAHAKIIDSDRGYGRGGYGLDGLSRDWLHEDIGLYTELIDRWRMRGRKKSKDFGRVHMHDMALYACQDVITNRRLKQYIVQLRHPDCKWVSEIETDLTSVLFQMERNGMRVDRIELLETELEMSLRLLQIDEELKRRVGRSVNASSNEDLYDLLINQFGLPIVAWTDEEEDPFTGETMPAGNASFNKYALEEYARMPYGPHEVVVLIQEARHITQTLGLFVRPYQELADRDGRMHGDFNQVLTTGRMSMRRPNLQQCSEVAKRLIHPNKDCSFLSADQSQIEFRVIAHYIENRRVIETYCREPDTDFHDWVAASASIKRKPAKTMNFMMGYGGGKKKAVRAMSANLDVIGGVVGVIDQMLADGRLDPADRDKMFDQMCKHKGEEVYDGYHRNLPELKPTSRRAAAVCAERGYVRNWHGRHRHLPREFAHKAFNSLCQGEAADIQKERTVALARALLGTDIMLVGNVHDEVVLEGPSEQIEDARTVESVAWMLETLEKPLRVPLRANVGTSRRHWKEASTSAKDGGPSKPIHYDASRIDQQEPFAHLRGWRSNVWQTAKFS